jgi:hypothetical protein
MKQRRRKPELTQGVRMNKVIITVDLGHFKAYRVTKNPMESTRVELIDSYDTIGGHEKLGEMLTDQAGSFGLSGGKKGVKGHGEPHNIGLETDKRLMKQIARDINRVIRNEQCEKWYLAASKTLNNQIVEYLSPEVKSTLGKKITADLTKTDKSEILKYFE